MQRNFLSNQLKGGSVSDFCAFVRLSRELTLREVPAAAVGKHLLAKWNALDESARQQFHTQSSTIPDWIDESDDPKKPRYDDFTVEVLRGWFHEHEQVRVNS